MGITRAFQALAPAGRHRYAAAFRARSRRALVERLIFLLGFESRTKAQTKKAGVEPAFFVWRPHGDSNPSYRRERAMS